MGNVFIGYSINKLVDLEDLPLPAEYIDVFREEGIRSLYEYQQEALDHIFRGKSIVVSVPTASGKTILGYLAILRAKKLGLKSVYIVPLRALAMEKYEELKKFEKYGLRVALAMGDYDSPGGYLERYDVVVATSEKMDSILRHNPDYPYELGVVVVDEVHLLGEESRGPTLEMVISRIRAVNDEVQFVALSATIKNSSELAEWLSAEHIYSEFRPVPLKLGVFYDTRIIYEDGTTEDMERDSIVVGNIVKRRIEEGGQLLIFVNRRKSAESLATKLQRRVLSLLSPEEKDALEELAKKIDEEEYTVYSEKISKMLRHGVAFHHAGLSNPQRRLVEDGFKRRLIKVIVATPTLAAGINLPSRTVIVRDLTRYDGYGSVLIPVMEVKQMLGRAGRPKYDRYGEGILCATSEKRAEMYMDVYIRGDTEEIESQLAGPRALRVHILSLIASDLVSTREDIIDFFRTTFYGHRIPADTLLGQVDAVVDFLKDNGFVEERKFIRATPLGKRVSDLYIDPESAILMEKCFSLDYDEYCVLHTISTTPDMRVVRAKKSEMESLYAKSVLHELAVSEFEVPQDRFFAAIKTANILHEWASEASQDEIIGRYDIGPGDLHAIVEMAEWLLYSFGEIAQVAKYPHVRDIRNLTMRVKYGVQEELLPIVTLRGVGRVRARRLFESGFNSIEKLRSATVPQLTRIPGIGERLAREILKQAQK